MDVAWEKKAKLTGCGRDRATSYPPIKSAGLKIELTRHTKFSCGFQVASPSPTFIFEGLTISDFPFFRLCCSKGSPWLFFRKASFSVLQGSLVAAFCADD